MFLCDIDVYDFNKNTTEKDYLLASGDTYAEALETVHRYYDENDIDKISMFKINDGMNYISIPGSIVDVIKKHNDDLWG